MPNSTRADFYRSARSSAKWAPSRTHRDASSSALEGPFATPKNWNGATRPPSRTRPAVASTSDAADQSGTAVCARVFSRLGAQPCAKADDLGAIRRALGRDQPVAQTGSLIDPVAAIARMVAETAGDQQIDLAFDQL